MPDATRSQQPKLLDETRNVFRLHHYFIHTVRSYVNWIVTFRTPWTISAFDHHPFPPV